MFELLAVLWIAAWVVLGTVWALWLGRREAPLSKMWD